MAEKTNIYFPDRSIKQGYLSLFKEMMREVISSRWLTSQLFKRNFSATYRQSALGIFWVLIIPLVSVGIFIFLNRGGIFNTGAMTIPYPPFAVAGVALWQLFSVGLTLGANSLVSAGSMITKINFTRESLVISAVAQGAVPCFVQIVVALVLFAVYQIAPPMTALLVPLAVIPLLLLTLGLGFVLAPINGVLRDVGNAEPVLVSAIENLSDRVDYE